MSHALRAVTLPPSHFIIRGIRVSHKLAPALLAAVFLAISSLSIACAAPAAPAASNAGALSPDAARRALETLQDDQKRTQMIDTLRAIANAPGGQQASPPAAEQSSPIPLSADGLGAQLLLTVSEQIGEISREVAVVARTLTHFPAF